MSTRKERIELLKRETEAVKHPDATVEDLILSGRIIIRAFWPHRHEEGTREKLRQTVQLMRFAKHLQRMGVT